MSIGTKMFHPFHLKISREIMRAISTDKMAAIFAGNISKCISLKKKFHILIKISLKFIH